MRKPEPEQYQKIVVGKGICTPIRGAVLTALQPYGVRFSMHTYGRGLGGEITADGVSGAYIYIAEIVVSQRAAAWTEYLLCRTTQFSLLSKPIDKRNMKWAARHNGVMPKAWVEPGCKIKQPGQGKPAKKQAKQKAWWQLW